MRRFILIAGFVLASAAAQAADRSLSLAGSETMTVVAAPIKTAERPMTAESTQAEASKAAEAPKAEVPRYVERPAVVEPRTETIRTETSNAETSKAVAPKVEQPGAEPARPVARKSASKSEKPRRTRYWTEARIIRELNRHGIYW